MISGRINKELKEICLLDQVYVKAEDGKQSVENMLQKLQKANGANVTIKGFVRYETGEGIEKERRRFCSRSCKTDGNVIFIETYFQNH